MRRVSRIGVLSLGKVLGAMYGLMGLLGGIFLAIASFFGAAFGDAGGFGAFLGGIGAVVFLPLIYGVAGFVGGLLTGWLYNLIAGLTGGLEVELR